MSIATAYGFISTELSQVSLTICRYLIYAAGWKDRQWQCIVRVKCLAQEHNTQQPLVMFKVFKNAFTASNSPFAMPTSMVKMCTA